MQKDRLPSQPYVFVSYSSDNRDLAQQVIDWLRENGISFWWDQNLPVGEQFPTALTTALNSATCAIVIWSETAIQSDHVLDEADRARRARRLLPVANRKFDVTSLPMGFGVLQVVRLDELDKIKPKLVQLGFTNTADASSAAGLEKIERRETIGGVLTAMKRKLQQQIGAGAVLAALAVALGAAFPAYALVFALGAAVAVAIMLAVTQ